MGASIQTAATGRSLAKLMYQQKNIDPNGGDSQSLVKSMHQ